MNVAAVISLLAASTGFVFGAIWWRISRAPGWSTMRSFSLVAFTAGGYCIADTFPLFDFPHDVIRWTTQAALAMGALHAYAWIRWIYAAQERPRDRAFAIVRTGAIAVTLLSLIPGALISEQFGEFQVSMIGVTYRVFDPTPLGFVGYLFFLGSLWYLAYRSFARWRRGWRDRMPALAVMVLTAVAVNDTLATARVIHTPFLVDLGFLVVIVAFGLESLGRFAEDGEKLEALTHRLEELVADRTRDLEAAQRELSRERTVAAVGRLAGSMAHEINNPATVISVNLGLMRDELEERNILSGQLGDMIDESRGALRRIIEIITDLRLAAGTVDPADGTRHESDLRMAIDRALTLVALRGSPNVTTCIDIPQGQRVGGDRTLVTRLFTELLANAGAAAHAARPGAGRVRITSVSVPDGVEVSIADNGHGVPEHVREALFEPFTGEGIRSGRGLGLAVVRGLAEQLGATLSLGETEDDGARFIVRFRKASRT